MALTKVTGHVIKSDTNITSHNINSSGIITAISFDGNVSGVAVTFTGDSTIGSLGITTNLTVGGNIDVSGIATIGSHNQLQTNVVGQVLGYYQSAIRFSTQSYGTRFTGDIRTDDGNKAVFGTDQDLEIYHSGGNSFVKNTTSGSLLIQGDYIDLRPGSGDTGEVMLRASRNAGVEIRYDNTKRFEVTNTGAIVSGILTVTGNMNVEGVLTYQDVTNIDSIGIVTARSGIVAQDDVKVGSGITFHSTNSRISLPDGTTGSPYTGNLELGNNRDFTIVHDSNHTYMTNRTGNFYIGISDSVFPIQLKSNNTAEIYHGSTKVLETTSSAVLLPDRSTNTGRLAFGDLGTRIEGGAGAGSSNGLFFMTNSGYKWQISGDGHLLPSTAGAVNIGSTGAEIGNVYLADNKHVYCGSDQDLAIVHNGTHGYIHAVNGGLYMKVGNGEFLSRNGNQVIAKFLEGTGGVELWYNNVKKFDTVETGIEVTGEVKATQDYPIVKPTLDFNFASEKKLDPRITYTRTGVASFVNEFGKVVLVGGNAPRFDHDPDTREGKGLLVEEERTNLLYPSSNWSSTYWSLSAVTSEINTTDTEDPAGTFTASKLIPINANNSLKDIHWASSSLTFTNGVKYAASVFAKSTTGLVLQLRPRGQGSNKAWVNYNLSTGTIGNYGGTTLLTKKIEKYPNGWYRCSLTFTGSGHSGAGFGTLIMDDDTDTEAVAFTGDSSKSMYLWGAQHEQGDFVTSYIPAPTTAAATRGADFALIDGEEFTEFFNQDQGTIITSTNSLNTSATQYSMVIEGDNTNNERHIFVESNAYQYQIKDGGSTVAQIDAGSISTKNITAAAYKLNDTAVSINGSEAATDTSATMPTCTKLKLGHWSTTVYNGHINRFIYYPQRISNTQLRILTS